MYIHSSDLGGALNGDKVIVRIKRPAGFDVRTGTKFRAEGEVIRILQRKVQQVVPSKIQRTPPLFLIFFAAQSHFYSFTIHLCCFHHTGFSIEETGNLPPADTVSELEAHLDAPKKRIEQLVTQIGATRNEIQSLETALRQHQYNLRIITEYVSTKDVIEKDDIHKRHICPNCGYIFDEEIFDLVRAYSIV